MDMAKRYDTRIPKSIRVKISGTDRYGNRFSQTASTLNISRSGARLEGVPLLNDAETVVISRGWFRKARFRVVWTGEPGTPEASQVGIRCVERDGSTFWGIDFPPPEPSNWVPPKQTASTVTTTIPESGPIPVQWDAYDADRAARTTIPGVKEPIVHAADAVPAAWREEPGKPGERRVPVTIRWSAQGKQFEESLVMARVLKDGSCMVSLKNSALEDTEVSLTHGYSGEKRAARISWCGPRTPDGGCPASIELSTPDPKFWDAAPRFG